MKILVATDKPFAAVAVNGIKDVVESAGIELALLEKYGEKSKLLDAVKDVEGLIVRSDIIDAEVLNAAKQLKVVVPEQDMTISTLQQQQPTEFV